MPILYPLTLGAALFSIGVYGVLARRNAILVLMSVEALLAGAMINLVTLGVHHTDPMFTGQVVALFLIAISAAEIGVGLAIVMLLYRNRSTANVDDVSRLRR